MSKGRGSLKAILTTEYGPPLDVLRLRQVATPEPSESEVLVKLFASSVNPLDDFAIKGPLFFLPKLGRLLKPTHKIAGADYAGIIESAGRDIKRFRPGDAVFGASFMGKGQGDFAEYVCVPEDGLAPKPTNLSFEQASSRARRGDYGSSGSPRSWPGPARAECSYRRRIWWRGYVCYPDCQIIWCRRNCRLQHEEYGQSASYRCGPCDRLHTRKFHAKRA